MTSKPCSRPSIVTAEQGEVLVDGPNGFAFSFTPEAALETSERLRKAGAVARGQREQAGDETMKEDNQD